MPCVAHPQKASLQTLARATLAPLVAAPIMAYFAAHQEWLVEHAADENDLKSPEPEELPSEDELIVAGVQAFEAADKTALALEPESALLAGPVGEARVHGLVKEVARKLRAQGVGLAKLPKMLEVVRASCEHISEDISGTVAREGDEEEEQWGKHVVRWEEVVGEFMPQLGERFDQAAKRYVGAPELVPLVPAAKALFEEARDRVFELLPPDMWRELKVERQWHTASGLFGPWWAARVGADAGGGVAAEDAEQLEVAGAAEEQGQDRAVDMDAD